MIAALLVAILVGGGMPVMAQAPDSDASSGQRFVLKENRVVQDLETNLEWWPAPDRNATWHEANRWAEYAAQFSGGWRMPTVEELHRLYGKDFFPHNISPLFQVSAYSVWAKKVKGDRSAWFFSYDTGQATWAARSRSALKRSFAVRATPPPSESK